MLFQEMNLRVLPSVYVYSRSFIVVFFLTHVTIVAAFQIHFGAAPPIANRWNTLKRDENIYQRKERHIAYLQRRSYLNTKLMSKWFDDIEDSTVGNVLDTPPIPVYVISGFLGAGKTTLLQNILENADKSRIGIIVNDLASINVDTELIKEKDPMAVLQNNIIELSNGCACCSAQNDFMNAITRLMDISEMKGIQWRYIIVEASGVSEPKAIHQMFQTLEHTGHPLSREVKLSRMITVIDAHDFSKYVHTFSAVANNPKLAFRTPAELLQAQKNIRTARRSVVDLLIEQVEWADVLVLNKMDMVTPDDLHSTEELVHFLNPNATLHRTTLCQLDLEDIMSEETAYTKKKHKPKAHNFLPEKETLTRPQLFSSFVYTAHRPFNTRKLDNFLESLCYRFRESNKEINAVFRLVYRVKGFVWIDDDHHHVYSLSQCGDTVNVHRFGKWKADSDNICRQASFGKRQSQLVFVGLNLHNEVIRDELKRFCDEAVTTDLEFKIYQQKFDTSE